MSNSLRFHDLPWRHIGFAALGGAALGLLLSPGIDLSGFWKSLHVGLQSGLFVLAGAAVAALVTVAVHLLLAGGTRLRIDSAKVQLPGGVELTLKIDERQREAGWRVFVELSTRIATQKLTADSGLIREALASLYSLFTTLRDELKAMSPATGVVGANETDIEAYTLAILNHAIRPTLSYWHPLLERWEERGLPEQSWPLATRCREDLEATRLAVLGYSRGLGEALRVPQLERLLAPPDAPAAGATVSGAQPAPPLGATHRKAGWRIYLQLQTRIATQSLAADEGLLSEALASLYALFDTIRTELSNLPGPAPSPDPDRSVEAISLRILNVHLRPLLARWHPRLEARKAANGNEADWSEAQQLRVVLERTRQAVVKETALLGKLIEAPPIEPG